MPFGDPRRRQTNFLVNTPNDVSTLRSLAGDFEARKNRIYHNKTKKHIYIKY